MQNYYAFSRNYSKRDYEAFAQLLKISAQTYYDTGKYAELEGVHDAISRCADLFDVDNPGKFNRMKFMRAACEKENWCNQTSEK